VTSSGFRVTRWGSKGFFLWRHEPGFFACPFSLMSACCSVLLLAFQRMMGRVLRPSGGPFSLCLSCFHQDSLPPILPSRDPHIPLVEHPQVVCVAPPTVIILSFMRFRADFRFFLRLRIRPRDDRKLLPPSTLYEHPVSFRSVSPVPHHRPGLKDQHTRPNIFLFPRPVPFLDAAMASPFCSCSYLRFHAGCEPPFNVAFFPNSSVHVDFSILFFPSRSLLFFFATCSPDFDLKDPLGGKHLPYFSCPAASLALTTL